MVRVAEICLLKTHVGFLSVFSVKFLEPHSSIVCTGSIWHFAIFVTLFLHVYARYCSCLCMHEILSSHGYFFLEPHKGFGLF